MNFFKYFNEAMVMLEDYENIWDAMLRNETANPSAIHVDIVRGICTNAVDAATDTYESVSKRKTEIPMDYNSIYTRYINIVRQRLQDAILELAEQQDDGLYGFSESEIEPMLDNIDYYLDASEIVSDVFDSSVNI